MSTSTTNLFRYGSIGEHLASARAESQRRIRDVRSIADLNAKGPDLITRAQIGKCTLHRDDAKFEVNEGATGVGVRLTVPLSGEIRLLSVNPGTDHPSPYATVDDGRWGKNGEGASFTLDQAFPAGTTAETVRAWGKEQIDGIEATLAEMHVKIDEYNATAPAEAEALIEERRQVLETGDDLRGNLEGGI